MTAALPADVRGLLDGYAPEVRAVAISARTLIAEVIPQVEETVDAAARTIGYGFGPGYRGMICTLILSKQGVKLGIVDGATLADPDRLLAGMGKRHKYVELTSDADVLRPGVRALVARRFGVWRAARGA
jgi:hypothetical protein